MFCDLIKETVMVRNIHHGSGKEMKMKIYFVLCFCYCVFGFLLTTLGRFGIRRDSQTHTLMLLLYDGNSWCVFGCSKLNETKVKRHKSVSRWGLKCNFSLPRAKLLMPFIFILIIMGRNDVGDTDFLIQSC